MLNLSKLPPKPGVYIFRNQQGSALYIGKAINLKNRVGSYLKKGLDLGPKTTLMVSKIKQIEHIVVESEIEALLLESDLIKRLKPKYNVQLKDDKAYKYVLISKTKNQRSKTSSKLKTARPEDFAKVLTTRKPNNGDVCFGPFPEGKIVNQVLRTLRRVFPFRDCSEAKFKRYQNLSRPCLYGDLKLCPAPCVGRISPKDYQKIILQLKRFLSGKSKLVVRELEKEMEIYSKAKEFEKAALVRDRIRNYEYVRQSFRPAAEYLEHPDLLEDRRRKELAELRKVVGIGKLERIEAFDISNISGQDATGSMVVFIGGESSKKDYRRFRIKKVSGISDVDMVQEVLRRRFAKTQSAKLKNQKALRSLPTEGQVQSSKPKSGEDKSFAKIPDLILIDGGKAQVAAVNEVLKEDGLDIPVLGLAKRFEEIITSDLEMIRIPKGSPALHLLQRLRDEAHRFALSYHRTLRSKNVKK